MVRLPAAFGLLADSSAWDIMIVCVKMHPSLQVRAVMPGGCQVACQVARQAEGRQVAAPQSKRWIELKPADQHMR